MPFSKDPSIVSSDDSSKNNYNDLDKTEGNRIEGFGQVFEKYQQN